MNRSVAHGRRATVRAVSRRLANLGVVVLALLATACDDEPTSTTAAATTATAAPSATAAFDCVAALAATGFTPSTPAGDAVQVLEQLVAEAGTTGARAYFQGLLDAAGELDPGEPVGTTLDAVPCDL